MENWLQKIEDNNRSYKKEIEVKALLVDRLKPLNPCPAELLDVTYPANWIAFGIGDEIDH